MISSRFRNYLFFLGIVALAVLAFSISADESEARLCVWDGGDAGALASTAANWDTDTAPIAGDNILFDGLNATGDDACTWDISLELGILTIGSGYSGTITQSSDMHITGYSQAGGTFTGGSVTKPLTCSGSFTVSAGTLSNYATYLIMTGTGTISSKNYVGLEIGSGAEYTVNTASSVFVYGSSSIFHCHGTLHLTGGKVTAYYYGVTDNFILDGIVDGTYALIVVCPNANYNFPIITGQINCPLEVKVDSGITAGRTFSLVSDLTVQSTVSIIGSASYTCTLNTNGHSLTATTITVGTRGILDCSNGTITCSALTSTSGTIIEDTATWIFNDGAIVTATLGEKFYNVQMKGDCDFVNAVNVTNDLRWIDVPLNYDDLDVYLDTVYSITISYPYSFGAEITASAEYVYLPDVQIDISDWFDDYDYSVYAYISSNIPGTWNITGTASEWLSINEGKVFGLPPEIGRYSYIITITNDTGSSDTVMGYLIIDYLDTAEYGFDIILGLIFYIIITILNFWGYYKRVPLLQVLSIIMIVFSALAMLRISYFVEFNILFVLANLIMFILGMIKYRRL